MSNHSQNYKPEPQHQKGLIRTVLAVAALAATALAATGIQKVGENEQGERPLANGKTELLGKGTYYHNPLASRPFITYKDQTKETSMRETTMDGTKIAFNVKTNFSIPSDYQMEDLNTLNHLYATNVGKAVYETAKQTDWSKLNGKGKAAFVQAVCGEISSTLPTMKGTYKPVKGSLVECKMNVE